jgi:hypothetical protein
MCHDNQIREVVWQLNHAAEHFYSLLCGLNAMNVHGSWQMPPINETSATTASAKTCLTLNQLLRSVWSQQFKPTLFVTLWLLYSLHSSQMVECTPFVTPISVGMTSKSVDKPSNRPASQNTPLCQTVTANTGWRHVHMITVEQQQFSYNMWPAT